MNSLLKLYQILKNRIDKTLTIAYTENHQER